MRVDCCSGASVSRNGRTTLDPISIGNSTNNTRLGPVDRSARVKDATPVLCCAYKTPERLKSMTENKVDSLRFIIPLQS